jgi:hypothetical protein
MRCGDLLMKNGGRSSRYPGIVALLREVTESTFRLQKRRYWRNDFAPHLYGQFQPEAGGSRIEAHFDVSRWVKTFMKIWLVGAILLGLPIFVLSALDALTGSHHTTGDVHVGLIVPPALILWGLVLPKLGRLLSRGDERSCILLGRRLHEYEPKRITVVNRRLLQCRRCQVLFSHTAPSTQR